MRTKKNKLLWVSIFLVIVSAILVRFISLDKVPASLYYDEIDLGYQVKSLLTTGKDYRGTLSPFFFRSMNTDKAPFPIYFSALPSLFFQSPDYQTRAGAALAGTISVVLAMVLIKQLTISNVAIVITGLVFAFSTWQIQFSRMAFETIFMQMVFLAAIICFLYWQKVQRVWLFFLSAFLLGLTVYTYRPMSLFAPITVLVILALFYRDFIKQGVTRVLLWLSIIGVMIIPFLYATTLGSADQPRINQISIFSDKKIPIFVQRNRELDSNDFANPEIGKRAVPSSFIFHNKVLSYLTAFGRNYVKSFSGEFLFLTGDPNVRHSPKNTGVLLFVDIIGLIAGLAVVGKNIKDKRYQLLLALLLLSPIPSDLTMDGGTHASRLMLLGTCLLFVIGLGYTHVVEWLYTRYRLFFCHSRIYTEPCVSAGGNPCLPARQVYKSLISLFALIILVSTWLLSVTFYLHHYFIHFPVDSSREFGYGYRQAIEKINQIGDQYQAIRLTENHDPPMPYYLFWANVPPKEVQNYGVEFGESIIKNQPLDEIKPIYFNDRLCLVEEIIKLHSNTLYLVTFGNLPMDFRNNKDTVPTGIKLIDIIQYPDNEVAYYLLTRDTKDGVEIQPDKASYCK